MAAATRPVSAMILSSSARLSCHVCDYQTGGMQLLPDNMCLIGMTTRWMH